jgi:hypothetical protein
VRQVRRRLQKPVELHLDHIILGPML